MPAYIPKKESCTTPPAHYRYRRGNNLKLEHLRTTYVAHTASSRRMQQRLDSALTSVDGMLDEAADLSRSLNGLTSENRVLSCMSQFIELSPAIEASPVHLYEREKPPPSPKRPLRKSTVQEFALMDTIFEGTNKHSILTAEASTIDRIQRLSLSLQTDGVESSIGTWPQSTWMTSPIERLSSTSNLADHSIHISSDAVENPPTNELRRQSELILPHHNQEWIKARRQLWQAFGNWINY